MSDEKLWVPKKSYSKMKSWIGIDLDGTLAHYEGFKGHDQIGPPIEPMLEFVKDLIAQGVTVKIFTARVSVEGAEEAIKKWCFFHGLGDIEITCVKDYGMVNLYDDRAIQVIPNTGRRADGKPLGG